MAMNDATFSADRAAEAEKRAALRRTKAIATGALAACLALFVVAKSLEGRYPLLGFVAAFAEAATIGGLADWYAVVALFKRPLGLPIPHTAIIPANQERIADNLGRFIEVNFLAPGPVKEKLKEVDFAAQVADWLSSRERAAGLSRFVARLIPQLFAAIDGSGLRSFATQRITAEIEKVRVAPLAAELLGAFTADGRHQRVFDQLMRALGAFLSDEAALVSIRDRVRAELPSLFNLFRADAYLVKKIIASAGALLEDAQHDPNHPLRREFDRFVHGFIEQLKTSPDYAARAEQLKHDFLARPEVGEFAEEMWRSIKSYIETDIASPHSRTREQLTGMLVEIGRSLAADPALRAEMNRGFVVALASFVEAQKSGVSVFVAEQVKRWDVVQMTRLIELNIGRDLQYIRFNGMLIGGAVGLLLHTAELLFLAN